RGGQDPIFERAGRPADGAVGRTGLAGDPRAAHSGPGAGDAPGGAGLSGGRRRLAERGDRLQRPGGNGMRMRSMLLAAGLLGRAAFHRADDAAPESDSQARAVNVVTLDARVLAGAIAASGPLIPREEAAVAPEVTGFRVARVLVEEGAYVRQGQTLAQLDPALL